MTTFKSYKDESKKDWGRNFSKEENPDLEQLQTGAILRIADSLERIASMSSDLMTKNQILVSENDSLTRSRNYYRGQVKKLKRLNMDMRRSLIRRRRSK